MLLLIAILLLNSFIVNSKVIELNNTNFITIRGQINEDTTNQFFIDINKVKTDDDINIFINSPGGSVMEGLKIVNYIEMLNEDYNVNCITDFSASMAFVILQSCKNRYAMSSSIMMQHQMSLSTGGNLFNIHSYLNMIDDMNVNIDKKQAERIGLEYNDFVNKITNDWWIYGEKGKEYNIVDDIVNIKCNKDIISKYEKLSYLTFLGKIEYTFYRCPLIRHPKSFKFNRNINESDYNKLNNLFNNEYYYSLLGSSLV